MRLDIVKPMLDKAMPVALGRYNSDDVIAMLTQNALTQGWFVMEGSKVIAIAVTTVTQYPRRRGLGMFLISGSRIDEWLEQWIETMDDYARLTGCDHMEAQGRRGWEKILDLEPRAIFLIRDVPKKEIHVDIPQMETRPSMEAMH